MIDIYLSDETEINRKLAEGDEPQQNLMYFAEFNREM